MRGLTPIEREHLAVYAAFTPSPCGPWCFRSVGTVDDRVTRDESVVQALIDRGLLAATPCTVGGCGRHAGATWIGRMMLRLTETVSV